ncbi:MAG: methylated-DNA--[protein]-cysteine S-methyltransferase [Lachnospiraceae bacterium]|nr:methylated-DNA--[protein]-cysteine S-methyltransferase [Lachnospiraceae bacterium]
MRKKETVTGNCCYIKTIPSPVGALTLASDGENLVGLWIENQKHFMKTLENLSCTDSDLPLFDKVKKWLEEYFSGRTPSPLDLPLKPNGSEYRQTIWKALLNIPYGQTRSYGEIAGEASPLTGKRPSARAAGGAIAHNPISIIIPCHRVIGTDGSITGYAGGIEIKKKLLELEGVRI